MKRTHRCRSFEFVSKKGEKQMLKVAVIGLGTISHIHIPAIKANQNAELVAVCDQDETLSNSVPGANFYSNYEVMLEKEDLDCVHRHVWKKVSMFSLKNHWA
jgi:myo-inositol-1-phosphate synthase